MKTHDLIQGTPEWLTYRASHFNASDAPAMMGASPYKTRAELLRELHTGVAPDVDAGTQKRFDNGHRLEAMARPLAEEFIGAELYPVTGSAGRLSASFDGLTIDECTAFEHKALNAELRAVFAAMESMGPHDAAAACRLLPLLHRVQMEQQLLVSGAERVLFMTSDWTADGELVEELHCWYYPEAPLRQQIIDGWAQIERDLAAYTLPASAEPAPVGKPPETLPALRIEIAGQVTASNLAEFRETALAAIRSVNRALSTDQDFADAEKAVRWCSDVEFRLAAAKEHALSQTASIDALFRTIDDISAEARRVRLDLDKLVTRRKAEVKEDAVLCARRTLDAHVSTLNAEIAPMRLQPVPADFAGAIKGLKSFASMQDRLDSAVAAAKIAADAAARDIRANLSAFKEAAAGFEFLFADLGTIVHKAADDFLALMQARIATHKAAEAAREEKRQADALATQRAESDRLERLAAVEAVTVAPPQSAPTTLPAVAIAAQQRHGYAPSPRKDEAATLNIGAICARLAPIRIDAAGLLSMGIKPTMLSGAAKMYRESDLVRLCERLQQHLAEVMADELRGAAADDAARSAIGSAFEARDAALAGTQE